MGGGGGGMSMTSSWQWNGLKQDRRGHAVELTKVSCGAAAASPDPLSSTQYCDSAMFCPERANK